MKDFCGIQPDSVLKAFAYKWSSLIKTAVNSNGMQKCELKLSILSILLRLVDSKQDYTKQRKVKIFVIA